MTIIFFNFMDLVNHDNLQACLPHNNNQNRELYRNCFTMLCWFLPYNNVNQPQLYIYPLSLESPYHPPSSQPPRSSQSTELSSLCYTAASYFMHGSIYLSVPCSRFVPPSPSPAGSDLLFYLRYIDDFTLLVESEEELKRLLMKVKEESKKLA